MNPTELEKELNIINIVMGVKIKALKAALTPEQLSTYNKVIEMEIPQIQAVVEQLLPQDRAHEVLRALRM